MGSCRLSVSAKHYLAWHHMARHGVPAALVLEDDSTVAYPEDPVTLKGPAVVSALLASSVKDLSLSS